MSGYRTRRQLSHIAYLKEQAGVSTLRVLNVSSLEIKLGALGSQWEGFPFINGGSTQCLGMFGNDMSCLCAVHSSWT